MWSTYLYHTCNAVYHTCNAMYHMCNAVYDACNAKTESPKGLRKGNLSMYCQKLSNYHLGFRQISGLIFSQDKISAILHKIVVKEVSFTCCITGIVLYLHLGDNGRRFRRPKRFMAVPSPMIAVEWWRVCCHSQLLRFLVQSTKYRYIVKPDHSLL